MRLIDADALREHFKEHEKAARNYRAFESADSWGGAVHDVEDAPTIDAEPVRHGQWIVAIVNNTPHFKCSECNKYIEAEWTANFDYVFCPNCGAKMDLEVQ